MYVYQNNISLGIQLFGSQNMPGTSNFGAGGEFLKLIGDWWVLNTNNVVLTMKTGILAILTYLTGMDINDDCTNLIVY